MPQALASAQPDQTPTAPKLPLSLAWLPELTLLSAMRADPETLPPDTLQAARSHLAGLSIWLQPAEPKWILARVMTLLGHWAAPRVSEQQLEAMARDWLESLKDLPAHAITEACSTWLREQEFKPTPAGIRKLTSEAIRVQRDEQMLLAKLLEQPRVPS